MKLSELKARIDECFDDKNDKLLQSFSDESGVSAYFILASINLGTHNLLIEHSDVYDADNDLIINAGNFDKISKNVEITQNIHKDETREELTPSKYIKLREHLEKRIEEIKK